MLDEFILNIIFGYSYPSEHRVNYKSTIDKAFEQATTCDAAEYAMKKDKLLKSLIEFVVKEKIYLKNCSHIPAYMTMLKKQLLIVHQ